MEEITAYITLFLMVLFFIGLIVLESLLKKIFNRLYVDEKKLFFWGKIVWLKNNFDSFELEDQTRVKNILVVQKLTVLILIAIFFLFLIGVLAK